MRRWWCGMLVVAVMGCAGCPRPAAAYSLLPLVAEEAQTLPSGVAELTLGAAYSKDQRFPAFTPPGAIHSQQLIEAPQLGFRIGAGNWAEIEATYETISLNERAANGQTNSQFGGGDMRMFTKIWLRSEGEWLPAMGMHFGTKLPNAVRSDRLGTDDTDFSADALFSKDLGPATVHANLGILLLGNSGPSIGHSFSAGGQDDLFEYTLAVVSAPLGKTAPGAMTLRLLSEVTGQTGSHYHNDRVAVRGGAQLQRGPLAFYLGVSTGLITGSENLGLSGGAIYRFEPGKLFGVE